MATMSLPTRARVVDFRPAREAPREEGEGAPALPSPTFSLSWKASAFPFRGVSGTALPSCTAFCLRLSRLKEAGSRRRSGQFAVVLLWSRKLGNRVAANCAANRCLLGKSGRSAFICAPFAFSKTEVVRVAWTRRSRRGPSRSRSFSSCASQARRGARGRRRETARAPARRKAAGAWPADARASRACAEGWSPTDLEQIQVDFTRSLHA
jgi:hypothetical protein